MKKFTSILLALVMILAMSIPAFAAESVTFSLTINGAANHTYAIYQIYTGDVYVEDDGTTVLSNIRFGKNHITLGYALGDLVPADELKDFTNTTNPAEKVTSMITNQDPYRTNITPADNESSVTVTGLPGGYYAIVDISQNLPAGQTLSPVILQMVDNVTITSKHASITSEKKVADTNDSYAADAEYVWQDSADYDVNDKVPFQLSVTLPSTFKSYTNGYTLTFHDQMASAFTTPEITAVYILQPNGNKIPVPATNYTLSNGCPKRDTCEFGGCSFGVEVSNIQDVYGQNAFTNGDKVVVEYTAILTDNNLVVGADGDGNVNGMYVCHPDGHTVKDYVTVLTYQLTVNKIDGSATPVQPLDGAAFTLFKLNFATGVWDEVGVKTAGEGITSFTWIGIDDGKYMLKETVTPDGYNTLADLYFDIISDHKTEWVSGGNSAFEDVVAKDAAGEVVFADRDEANVEDGKLAGNVANHRGTVLPETGAEGTVLLVTVGTLLVVLAAVFMITRKKMSIYED